MRACMCVCVHVCVCHIFTSTFISHSFVKISSPSLQKMLMAMKTCAKSFYTYFKKHGRLFEDRWYVLKFKIHVLHLAVSDLHKM